MLRPANSMGQMKLCLETHFIILKLFFKDQMYLFSRSCTFNYHVLEIKTTLGTKSSSSAVIL